MLCKARVFNEVLIFGEVPVSKYGELGSGKSPSCANGERQELARGEQLCLLLDTGFGEGLCCAQTHL